jgi:hypothetical protein
MGGVATGIDEAAFLTRLEARPLDPPASRAVYLMLMEQAEPAALAAMARRRDELKEKE